jgi:hypothetical protein
VKILPQKISGTLIRVSVYFDIDSYYFCEGVHVLKFESVLALLELAEQLSALLLLWSFVILLGNVHFPFYPLHTPNSSLLQNAKIDEVIVQTVALLIQAKLRQTQTLRHVHLRRSNKNLYQSILRL